MNNIAKTIKTMLAAVMVAGMVVSCEDLVITIPGLGTEQETGENKLTVPNAEVESSASNQYVTVTAFSDWTLSLDFGEGVEPWATLSRESGSKGVAKVTLKWEANPDTETRTLAVVLSCGESTLQAQMTQKGQSAGGASPTDFASDPVYKWLEIPAIPEGEQDRYFITHYMPRYGKTVRNYSFYLDARERVSIWVAYPLNKGLIGKGSRNFSNPYTTTWSNTIDPKVPREYQAVTERAFSGYQRGHQIPSADRYDNGPAMGNPETDSNFQTFFGTNMTPQKSVLNENAWASLEGMVRTWANSFDTLYVVTGCDIQKVLGYASDSDRKSVAIPQGYFKALLGYNSKGVVGNTGKQGGFTAIGVYLKHQSYSDSDIKDNIMSIDDLETMMGIDFFPNLEARVGSNIYSTIESTVDSFWK